MPAKRIAYYITPHGFGHAIRSLEIIRALGKRHPDAEITPVTDLPAFLFDRLPAGAASVRVKRLDVGLAQRDSLRFDLDETLDALDALFRNYNTRVDEEETFLREGRFGGIVSDIAFAPFTAAKRLGLPSVGVGNFTWDWIYEAYGAEHPRFFPFIFRIRNEYGKCCLFLRLPMHGDCSVFPVIRDVPLVARKSRRPPEETRRILGIEKDRCAVLAAFSSLDMAEDAQRRLEALGDAVVLFKKPMVLKAKNARCLDEADLPYEDVVAAVDAVVTKPGYGIVGDCIANNTPMLYCDRGPFREYDILVAEMRRRLAATHLPMAELLSGNWKDALEGLMAQPAKTPDVPVNGAAVCAERIARKMNWE